MKKPLVILTLLCTAAFGCNDDDPDDVVTTRSSATADFTEYGTFAFPDREDVIDEDLEDDGIPAEVEANLDIVNDAVRTELTQLGLVEVDVDDEPDLVVFNLAATDEQEAIYWTCVDGYWYGYWSYAWNPCSWLVPVYEEYTEGAIVVALADPERNEVVFGGVIGGVAYDELDDDELTERVNDDVNEMFEDYPADQTGTAE